MPLSSKQINAYWRLWTRAAAVQGWTTLDGLKGHEIQELRHRAHHDALCNAADRPSSIAHRPFGQSGSDFEDCKSPHSLKTLNNHQFDLIKAHFELLANGTNLSAAMRLADPETGDRKRLTWRINALAPEAYWKTVCHDKFHTTNLEDLDLEQLTQLRNTLAARANKKKGSSVTLAPSAQDKDLIPF